MTDETFLEYLKVKAINEFNQKNLIIGEISGNILHEKPKVKSTNSTAAAATSTAIVNNAKFRSGSPFWMRISYSLKINIHFYDLLFSL